MRISALAGATLCAVTLFAQTPAPATNPPVAPPEREPGAYATFETSMGNITVKLFEKESPITVKNFIDLALGRKAWTDPKTGQRTRRALYPGTIFHRVIPNFMIQGGDPLGTGTGGSDDIPDEFAPGLTFNVPGRLAMANAGPNTGSSQFFITEVPTPHLDGKHTIFGQVVEGQEIVGQIARVPKDDSRPLIPVTLIRVRFQRVGPGAPIETPIAKKAVSKTTAKKVTTAKPATTGKPATTAKPASTAPKKAAAPKKQ